MNSSFEEVYSDSLCRIICGDCIEVMAGMEENSVDAICTDPPYGLEFMGKEWDRLEPARVKQRWAGTERKLIGTGIGKGGDFGQRLGELPHFRPKRNAKCRRCGHYRFSGTPCQCSEPDWDDRMQEHAYLQQCWHQQWAEQALRVLKPGGHLLAFGGSRTHHRLYCGLEDAGFEIRDTLCWIYGSGFPKSEDVSKAIDKSFLREQLEAELGRKPTREEFKEAWEGFRGVISKGKGRTGVKAQPHGGSPFSDDSYKWPGVFEFTIPATPEAQKWAGFGTALKPAVEFIVLARKPISEKNIASNVLRWGTGGLDIDGCRIGTETITVRGDGNVWVQAGRDGKPANHFQRQGRWPANVILDEEAAEMLDEQSGESVLPPSRDRTPDPPAKATWGLNRIGGIQVGHNDKGGASRFFYCAKSSPKERGKGNSHPTCKPVDLMEWLIRLVSMEGQTILDPFAGSMSTVLAAVRIGRMCIAIEKSREYCDMGAARCTQGKLLI